MNGQVGFSPEAEGQLLSIFRFISKAASPQTAAQYTNGILNYCESLSLFPNRGTRRDDIRPGLRTTNFKKRTVIAFEVEESRVSIIGIFYGGQDFETRLLDDESVD